MPTFACFECGAKYRGTEKPSFCVGCFNYNSCVEVPIAGEKVLVQTRERKVLTAKELAVRHQKGSKIAGFEYLGSLPDLWTLLVYGPPGEGKSTYALLLAAASQEKTLFFAVEEGQSESLIRKLVDWEIRNDQILISDAREAREIRQDIDECHPSLIVIDSVTALGFTIKSGKTVWVAQSTKTGGFRGSQEIAHDADIVVHLADGMALVEKSRFGETGRFKFREKGDAE